MPAVVSLLRAVNVGGRNQIRMEALRALCESLKLRDVSTYVQSGNVVFRSAGKDLAALGRRIEDAIERSAGFRPDVMLRGTAELRSVIDRNPFAGRRGIEPGKLLVVFLTSETAADAREAAMRLAVGPEELRIAGRELYVYYPNGVGRAKLTLVALERALRTRGTGRNWNTVTRLLEIAEALK